MKNDIPPTCSRHKVSKEWRTTTFEYREGEISVKVPGVYGWVCPVDSEVSFTPEMTDELVLSVRELVEAAKRARARRSSLTEYVVKTG